MCQQVVEIKAYNGVNSKGNSKWEAQEKRKLSCGFGQGRCVLFHFVG
jgi:hypothetical protein